VYADNAFFGDVFVYADNACRDEDTLTFSRNIDCSAAGALAHTLAGTVTSRLHPHVAFGTNWAGILYHILTSNTTFAFPTLGFQVLPFTLFKTSGRFKASEALDRSYQLAYEHLRRRKKENVVRTSRG
jgi:hypothetical protein